MFYYSQQIDDPFIVELIENAAILLVFSIFYERFWLSNTKSENLRPKIVAGLIISSIGIITMLNPWTLSEGLIFDTRSIVLSMSGLFFGALPTFVAMVPMLLIRIYIGGYGVWMGVSVIIISGCIGIIWKTYRPFWKEKNYFKELLIIGILVHIFMLGATVLLPKELALPTFKKIALPVIFIYPLTTLLLGWMLVYQYKSWLNRKAKEKLTVVEKRNSEILNSSNLVSIILDVKGNLTFCNPFFLEITGYKKDEIINTNWFNIFIPNKIQDNIKEIFHQYVNNISVTNEYENEILTKDGQKLYISWYNMLLKNEDGIIEGVACIGINITQRKALEKELLTHRNHLEVLVSERTQELEAKNTELERFNKLFVDREFRIKELKDKLKETQAKFDQLSKE